MAGSFAATTLSGGARAASVTRGGTFTFARAADCLYLDPVHTAQNADIWISLNLYDTLIQPTADGKGLEPGLAESYAVSEDGKEVTLKIRPGLKFADGSPLALSDIKWSLDRARDKATGGDFQFLLEAIGEVVLAPPATVVLKMSHPDPAILEALATFNAGIMSEKLVMAAPGADLEAKSKSFAEHPVGSGPFVLGAWTHNTEMVLTRNPHYWKDGVDGEKLPYLDRVRFLIIPDDATRILKLRAGEIDGTEFVPFSRVAELKADPKLDMVLYPSAKVIYFNLNNRPTFKDGRKNPMADVRVRQALNHATDKAALIQVLSYGFGTPQQTYMPTSTPYAYAHGEPYPYDVAKAKKLLADAGYAKGFTVSCMALAGNVDDVAQLSALQQMWGEVGVQVKIKQLENATRLTRFKAGDYEMRTSLWTNDIKDPNEITSYFAYYPTVHSNRSGFRDTTIEALFEASQKELDPKKREAQYTEIQQRYIAAAPIVFLLEVPYPIALARKVRDFVQIPLGNNIFLNTHLEG
ncbi:MAG: peptide ABC transporter substrate-binding protein [Rhodospirillales bacterium 70-18]|nr:MAG: peptide ABC transporter substrate-binding protein [Rhodospirillales bacterium 70-18]